MASKSKPAQVALEGAEKPGKKQPRTGRGGKYNFPQAQPPPSADVAREALKRCYRWYKAGESRPRSDDEIEQALDEYFRACISDGERPTVESMCLAIGYDRGTVYGWESGRRGSKLATIIKRAKSMLSAFDAALVCQGDMPYVPYIFRAKNYYGLSDTVSVSVAPQSQLSDEQAEDIAAKYKLLPDE